MPFAWKLHGQKLVAPDRDATGRHRASVEAALRAAGGGSVHLRLRLDAGPALSVHLIADDGPSARWLSRVLVPAYPEGVWRPGAPPAPTEGTARFGHRFRPWPDSLRSGSDPTAGWDAAALAARAHSDRFVLELVASPSAAASRPTTVPSALESTVPDPTLRPGGSPTARLGRPGVLVRLAVPIFWHATVTLTLPPELEGGASARAAAGMEAALRSANANGVRFGTGLGRRIWRDPGFPISESELAAMLPGGEPAGSVLDGPTARLRLPLGRTASGRVVGPPVEPGQGRHLAVLGETGMGKSSLLVAVAERAARESGVLFLDPLGETVRALRRSLGPRYADRLLWIAPTELPPALNALEGTGVSGLATNTYAERRRNDLVHALRRVRAGRYTDSGFWGPRLEEMLLRAVRAAGALPDGTLADAHTLLATGGRTRVVVPPEAMEPVRELSDRIRERPEDADGARRLLHEVVRSPTLEQMLCARSPTMRASDLVQARRIVLVSGDAAEVGESTARYLLAVYLALAWSELLARPATPKTFVLLDEAQWYGHESLAEMLRLSRRRNVHVVLATQGLAALPDDVREAVWTNVADVVAFRGAPEEARELARASRAVSAEAILGLGRGEAAVLLGKGRDVEWIRTARVPGVERTSSGVPDQFGTSGSPSPTRAPETPESKPPQAPDEEELVLEWIRTYASAQPPGDVVRVPVARVRREVDPGGALVRAVGARLGRSGALARVERSRDGPVWCVRPERLPAASANPATSAGTGSTRPTQPS